MMKNPTQKPSFFAQLCRQINDKLPSARGRPSFGQDCITFCQLSLQQLNQLQAQHFLESSSFTIRGRCFTITYSSFSLGPYSGENDSLETSKNLQTYNSMVKCMLISNQEVVKIKSKKIFLISNHQVSKTKTLGLWIELGNTCCSNCQRTISTQ
jgi:hypothetical protein